MSTAVLRRPPPPVLASERPGAYRARRPASGSAVTVVAGPDVVGRLGAAIDTLGEAIADDALDGLDERALREVFDRLQQVSGLASAGQARTMARLSRTGAVRADGASSPATWIQGRTGRSTREASRLARLAGVLDGLPSTAAAVADGALTEEGADAIAQAARDGRLGTFAEVDAALAPLGRGAAPEQLRREIRRRTQLVDGASMLRDERRAHAARRLALRDRPDGMTDVHGQLPREMSNRLRTCLDALDRPDAPEVPPELRRSHGQRLADALDAAVGQVLGFGELPAGAGRVPQVVVHVELATLQTDLQSDDPVADGGDAALAPGELGEPSGARAVAPDDPRWAALPPGSLAWGGELSPQAVRRLLCDAGVSRVVSAGTSLPIDLGRTTRSWSAAQRRAVDDRDRGCRGPWCDRPMAWTQIHHLRWWRDGGATSVRNGIALCHACHHLVHDRGWQVRLDHATGDAHWTAPDGRTQVARARGRPRPG